MQKELSASVQFDCRLRVWTNPFVPNGIPYINIGSQCRPRFFRVFFMSSVITVYSLQIWSDSLTAFRSSLIVANSFADSDRTDYRSGMIMIHSLQTLIWLLFRRIVINCSLETLVILFLGAGVISVCSLQLYAKAIISDYGLKPIIRLLFGAAWSPTCF